MANGWVVPANIPAGLTAVVTRVSSTNVSVTLSGRATAHAAANSTNNLGLTFLNAAFFGNNASLIANAAVPNLDVTFLDPATNVQLLYGGTVFAESTNNDGSIATTIGITLTNDLFNGNNGDDFVGKGWVVPANVPAGLTAVVTRVDLTHVNASLAGKAAANSSSDSIGNLTLTFQNNSFYNTAAFAVTNSSRSDLAVQFLNPVLTYIGNGFREFWQNNGAIDNNSPVQVNLAGETFAGSVGANLLGAGVTVANVPSGLTAVVTKKASQTVAITLTGVAPANEAADSITNLTVSFGDAAFAASPASIVANSGPTNLAVTFYSAASNLYVATVANGGSDSNDGSLAHPFATLKKAVSVARANNNDTINVLAGTYTESNIVVNGKTVTIQGAGKTNTIVQGAVAPFSGVNQYIFWMTGSQTMALRDMTIRYGDYTNGTPQGSAIYSTVPGLYVTGCSLVSNNMVSANTVAGGSALSLGGGPAARATVLNCDVIGNTVKAVPGAGSYGGGIAVWQSLVISNGIFSGNVATNGGALYVNPGCPSLSVYDSSFNGNSANIYGGAVMVDRATNTLFQGCSFISNSVINSGGGLEVEASATAYTYLINCTFAGNTAGGGGGFLGHYDSRARIYNCTFVGNTAGTGGGAAMAHCTSWVIDSTIMASNNATTAPDLDQGDGVNLHAVTNCLIGNNSGCATIFPAGLPNAKGCYVGTAGTNLNPLVGVPSDNGGPTWTCALLPGSPAIDHGDNPLGLDWDQRGYKHVRVFKAQCDIGAFEFSLPTSLLFIVQ
ncbi:MAG: choice-of-anchor Q domain-containing protein [bacterium]